jgi:CheY-like chemotaxis protein
MAGKKTVRRFGPEALSGRCADMDISTKPYALVVDDDAIILMDACDILEEAGFRFYEAGTGDEAIRLLEDYADSVILLFSDVEMPGNTDGFALARHVARHWPWIEIVIASGRVTPGLNEMPTKATFISKPFNHEMVHEHLRQTLPDHKKPEPLKRAV